MNGELEKQLAKVVEQSLQIAEKTGEFVIEQAPDLLREFYTWHIISSIVWMAIGVILIWAGIKISNLHGFKSVPNHESEHNYRMFAGRFFYINGYAGIEGQASFIGFRTIGFIIGSLIFTINLLSLLKVIIAPKLYLIQSFIN